MTGYRGPNVTICGNVQIGEDVHIEAGAVIGRMPRSNGNANHDIPASLPPTVIGDGCIIGANTVIYAGVILGERVAVHDLCRIREGCVIDEMAVIGASVTIDFGCKIGARSRIMDKSHLAPETIIEEDVFLSLMAMTAVDKDVYLSRFGIKPLGFQPPIIRRWAFLGPAACVLPGVEVGEGAVLAAGAVATKNVPAWNVFMGVPAKWVGYVDPDDRKAVEAETWLKTPVLP